ncbi:MAG: extracellular solute-binding protein [Geminicoccaceae bacterium]|nr:extracellular solute-binding protein [Geminicoccaceae bacterium]
MFRRISTSRRHILQGMGGLAAAGSLAMPFGARAQSKGRIVVGTWGGDYARLLRKNIEEPILVPEGWEVIQDQAGDPERRAKMAAERRLPRGTTDIQGLSAVNMYQVLSQGLSQTIDYDRMSNGANVLPALKYDFGVAHIYSGMVAVYNPDKMDAPKSYAEVFDPKWGDRLGFIDIQYQYTQTAAALAAGSTPSDLTPGHKVLMDTRKAGARVYPTNEAFAQGLKTEEIDIGIMWKARTVQWQNAGINVRSAVPSEGALAYVSGFSIPANAPNLDGAYAYLDAMLSPSAQENFAIDMGYNPTVTNAEVAPDLNERIGFTPEQRDALVNLDYAYMAENDVALKEWWDKDFKG